MLHIGNLVYLDLHKTGSTFLARFFKSEIDQPVHFWSKHTPPRQKPKEPGEVWIMSVRDPLTYYVSLWAYGGQKRRGVYLALDEAARSASYAADDPRAFQSWMRYVFAADELKLQSDGRPVNKVARDIRRAQRMGIGLYTYRLLELATAQPGMERPEKVFRQVDDLDEFFERHARADAIVRLESLPNDLAPILRGYRVPLRPGALERLAASPPANKSEHGSALAYYTAELEGMVRFRDEFVFGNFYSA